MQAEMTSSVNHMKRICVIILLFLTVKLSAQSDNKTLLEQIIKGSVIKEKKKISTPYSTSWYFNNTDSLYFKSDTIKAIIYKDSKHKSMCKSVDWTFYNKSSIILGGSNLCVEPPRRFVTKYPNGFLSIKLKNENENLILDLVNPNEQIESSFFVNEILSNQSLIKITLVRRKQ